MLNYNEIKQRRYIIHEDAPWEVLSSQVSRKQANKPVNKTKLKNLITGQVIDHTFHVSDKVDEAELERKKIVFIYERNGEYWFHEDGDKSARFSLEEAIIGEGYKYLKPNGIVDASVFEEEIIGLKFPIKMDFEVKEAPPAIKGNTASGGDKVVVIETGAPITTPLFINEGDIIRINTETGEYVERAEKN
jgi:elongation factor P